MSQEEVEWVSEAEGALLVGISWHTNGPLVPAIVVPWLFGGLGHLGAPGSAVLEIPCVWQDWLGVASPFGACGSVSFQP